MSAQVLVPAWPEVLRAGLPVSVPGDSGIVVAVYRESYTNDGEPIGAIVSLHVSFDEETKAQEYSGFALRDWHGSLDLRDHAVRDACVRALWRKLRPEEPEPFCSPRWGMEYSSPGVWFVGTRQNHFVSPAYNGPTWVPSQTVVPALAGVPLDHRREPNSEQCDSLDNHGACDCPLRDRDLLALAVVLTHVFGGGNG